MTVPEDVNAHLRDPENATCFGGSFGHFITKYILGYEMMIISSFKNLLPATEGSGYVKNLLTGIHYYYRVQWMGKWRYIAGLLPSFFFTLVASVLLRQIHYHGFKFLTHFHHLLHEGIPMPIQTGAQVPFLIITYATIGLVIVMSEALGDDSVFCLLMVSTVWEADQFYAVFCRHKISKAYFPMFFFLYHSLPYAYFLRFNGQFWFLPFLFHWLLMQNAILFFFHHFELSGHNQVVENLIQPANFQQQNTNQPEQPLLEVQPLNEGEAVERTTTSPEQDEQSAEHRSPVEESRTLSAVFIPTLREDHMSAVELVNRRAGRSTDIHSIRERSLMHLDRH